MNLQLLFTVLLAFSCSFITFGQHEFCRMVGASSLILTEDCSYEDLPNGNIFRIAIHIIRNGNGEGGIIETQNITEEVLMQQVETTLNEAFDFPSLNPYESPCVYVENGFTFNAISLDYIDEDVYYQPSASELFEDNLGMNNGILLSSLVEFRNNCSAINIYLSDEYCDVDGGVANNLLSQADILGIWLGGITTHGFPMSLSSVLAHEMGHIFGLSHVFYQTNQFILNASNSIVVSPNPTPLIAQTPNDPFPFGQNCTDAGDHVCDTYPIPLITEDHYLSEGGCTSIQMPMIEFEYMPESNEPFDTGGQRYCKLIQI